MGKNKSAYLKEIFLHNFQYQVMKLTENITHSQM